MGRFHPISMTWHDLAFLHWPFPAELIRPLIPSGLELDTFEGQAWIGIVPFSMTGVGYPALRHLPIFSRFLEVNVRTYVKKGPFSGIWFFSLDAASSFAVKFCRRVFYLPYFLAEMSLTRGEREAYRYHSVRRHAGKVPILFSGSYRPKSDVFQSRPGDLDYWLTERYCLFAEGPKKQLYRCDIRHPHWPLQKGEAEIEENTLLRPLHLQDPAERPLVHFAKKLVVKATHLILA